jgi:hypothetical protein
MGDFITDSGGGEADLGQHQVSFLKPRSIPLEDKVPGKSAFFFFAILLQKVLSENIVSFLFQKFPDLSQGQAFPISADYGHSEIDLHCQLSPPGLIYSK